MICAESITFISNVSIIVALFITSYEANTVLATGVPEIYDYQLLQPSQQQQGPIKLRWDKARTLSLEESVELLRQSVINEANMHPYLYDKDDIEAFANDQSGWSVVRYLNQRTQNLKRAYRLAVGNLRWRAKMGINQLDASQFPCDIFKMGLIFESGVTHGHMDDAQALVPGNPVIWIRVGALGSVIKRMEAFSPRKFASAVYHKTKSFVRRAKDFVHRARYHSVRAPPASELTPKRQPLIENLSVDNDKTINHIMKAIAWWIDDWERKHEPGSRATLVLDFEDTDFAFSSWSTGEFLMKLDDHFPDLFDQIIGFRYKPKFWSLHSPISMLNRIFKSRISSTPETDMKLKFVRSEPQIGDYMPRVDIEGFTVLPDHVSGMCYGPIMKAPDGCQADAEAFGQSTGLFDPLTWRYVNEEFYQICKPKSRMS